MLYTEIVLVHDDNTIESTVNLVVPAALELQTRGCSYPQDVKGIRIYSTIDMRFCLTVRSQQWAWFELRANESVDYTLALPGSSLACRLQASSLPYNPTPDFSITAWPYGSAAPFVIDTNPCPYCSINLGFFGEGPTIVP